jgi:hypothetical protein
MAANEVRRAMQRLWYLAHAIASFAAAWLSFILIKPDGNGNLDASSRMVFEWVVRFYGVQAFIAVVLFFILRRTKGALNFGLSYLALLWTALMFVATQISTATF